MERSSSGTVEGRASHRQAPGASTDVDVILRDGRTLRLRPPVREDVPALTAFFRALSPQSLYNRFHGTVAVDDALAERFVDPDFVERGALIGETEGEDRRRRELGASARSALGGGCVRRRRRAAELRCRHAPARAARRVRGRGRDRALRRGGAAGQPRDAQGLRRRGPRRPPRDRRRERGDRLPDRIDQRVRLGGRLRDHVAVVASLRPFFQPRAVAIVGASARRGTIGGELFRNVLAGEFAGAAYPVNRKAEPVGGVRAYASIEEIPDEVDLAVICLPGEHVLACGRERAPRRRARALRDLGRLCRARRGGRAPARKSYLPSCARTAPGCSGRTARDHVDRRAAQRHVRGEADPARQRRLLVPERRTRARAARGRGRPRARSLGLLPFPNCGSLWGGWGA